MECREKGEGKQLGPTLNSKCTRKRDNPVSRDTDAAVKATWAPYLAHRFTQDRQVLHTDAPFNPYAHDPQLS